MLVLYLFLSLLAFQIEQFEDSCNACTACKVCVPCQLCPDTCNKCYGAFANTTGCAQCQSCLHCKGCDVCTSCYRCFAEPMSLTNNSGDDVDTQRAMSIQSVTSWSYGAATMESSSVSSYPPRRRVVLAGGLQLMGVGIGFVLVTLARHRIYGKRMPRNREYVVAAEAPGVDAGLGYPEEAEAEALLPKEESYQL